MKKFLLIVTLILPLFFSTSAYARDVEENYSALFVIPDLLIYRPVGVAITAVGAALFVATSPFTALAQISPPHNAFEKMSDILIMAPGKYTFSRPAGNMLVLGH